MVTFDNLPSHITAYCRKLQRVLDGYLQGEQCAVLKSDCIHALIVDSVR
jgi:hypothetical protein